MMAGEMINKAVEFTDSSLDRRKQASHMARSMLVAKADSDQEIHQACRCFRNAVPVNGMSGIEISPEA